jgi:glycine/D-amino acid oxidase-like deaminating enzyme
MLLRGAASGKIVAAARGLPMDHSPTALMRPGRRALLRGLAALAVPGAARVWARAAPLRVGVVGGGIIGSSIALHLAEAGARVTLFEKLAPTRGATQNSFGFLNIFDLDRTYQGLRLKSFLAYRRLDGPLRLGVTWGGYIAWASSQAEAGPVRAAAATLDGTPYEVRRIDAAEFRRLSPAVEPGPLSAAFYSPFAGHVDPVRVTYRMLARARALGVEVRYPCEVLAIELRGERLAGVRTDQGPVALERLVVAAGVDSPALLATLGYHLPLRHAPGILAHSVPLPVLTRLVYDGPDELEFKQMASGSIVGELHFEPPDIPAHREIRAHVTDYPNAELRAAHGQRILERIATVMPGARGARLERLTLGFRPMPIDGFPVVGPTPGAADVHMAVTHSGISLAAILGRYVSREILTEAPTPELAPYRPTRFGS